MKRIGIIVLLLCLCAGGYAQQGSEGIALILQQVEANNKQLQANNQLISSQKIANRSENNLPNPTLSYSHLWDSDDKNITVGELVISQGFDFPTLYATRSKMNRLRNGSLDAQATDFRQQILLQAQEACLDIIYLHQQQELLEERLKNAEDLAAFYQRRLAEGDANVIETNKINLELLNVRTEVRTNRTQLEAKLKELTVLNGDQPLLPGRPMPQGHAQPSALNLGLTDYPAMPLPAEFDALCAELLAADPSLQALEHQSRAAHRQVSVNKQGWLPKLELGYRRNTETRHPLNGLVVGFSFPLFENRGKVKTAKAQALNTNFQYENARLQASAALWQLYDEAQSLQTSINEYRETFGRQQDLKLLRRALDAGQISMIEYFVEVSVIYQSKGNLLQLENQYHKTMARLYKSRL